MPNLLQDDENKKLMDWVSQSDQNQNVLGGTIAQMPQPNEDSEQTENDSRIRDANPGHQPQDLKSALPAPSLESETQGRMNQVNQYGPEQEKAVLNSILKSHGSFGDRATRGLAGFGDALMLNAGKSSPGFLNSINEREGKEDALKAGMIPALRKANAETQGATQNLEMQTNTSPLGKAAADFLRPVIKSVYPDLSPEQTEKMLRNPSMAASNLGIPAQILESKAKIAMAGAELGLHQQVAKSTAENQQSQRENEAQKQKLDAAEAVVKNSSWLPKFLGGTSHKDLQKAREIISNTASGEENKVSDEDTTAIEWAKSNPKDPRASKILKLHGL